MGLIKKTSILQVILDAARLFKTKPESRAKSRAAGAMEPFLQLFLRAELPYPFKRLSYLNVGVII
jgi:hypothetical protein